MIFEGFDTRTSLLARSIRNKLSEISLISVIQAWLLGTISVQLFDAIILAAAVTMILTVVTSKYEAVTFENLVVKIFSPLRSRFFEDQSYIEKYQNDHVIVVGYGRQGRLIVEKIEDLGHQNVIVENDPVLLEPLRRECSNYVIGDAMVDYPMELAKIEDAQLIISILKYTRVSETILALRPDTDLPLRTDS